MKKMTAFLFVAVGICVATSALASSPAGTNETPVALATLSGVEILTESEADAVRGEGTALDPDFWQDKSFVIGANNGYATGSLTLFEGVIATFEYSKLYQSPDGSETLSLKVEGNIGGLSGRIGINQDPASSTFGELNFLAGGKSLSESTDFEGDFVQHFEQHFEIQTLLQNLQINLP